MTGITRAVVLVVGLAVAGAGVAVAGPQRPYRVSDQQLKELVGRIDTHRDAFHASFQRAIDRHGIEGRPSEVQIDRSLTAFEEALDLFRDRLNDRRSDTADAENLLRRASVIDGFMVRNRLDGPAQGDWQALRLDMDALSRAYGMTWSWRAASQATPSRVDDRQLGRLLKQIGEKAERFDKSLDGAFDRGRGNDARGKDEIQRSVKDFRQAAERLRDRVNGRQSNTLDIEDVLRRGVSIDGFMQRHQLSTQAERNWLSLRGDLDGLARACNVPWAWGESW